MSDPEKINVVSGAIVDAAIQVHRILGPGLLESVYTIALAYELRCREFDVERELAFDVKYRDITIDRGFRVDLLIIETVVVEVKSVETVLPVHAKQLQTYLKLLDKRLGLLLNFNVPLMREGITRIANGM